MYHLASLLVAINSSQADRFRPVARRNTSFEMARTIQTARRYIGSKEPRETMASERFRGVPSVTTCEVPVLEVQTTKAVTRTLRTRKVESDSLVSTRKVVPRQGPFNFMGLPPEIRLRIYEMCVSVIEYMTYDERDYCTCGGIDHRRPRDSEPEPKCKYVETPHGFSFEHDGFTRRQPGRFYMVSPNYITPIHYPFNRYHHMCYINARMTPRPSILVANSLIRQEALPVFYSMNDFVFEDCDCSWVTRWLYDVVQPGHLKYIRSITWDGPLELGGNRFFLEHNTLALMSSIIMLKQLGILGNCKVRLMPDDGHGNIHFACILHDKISGIVERKGLTATHAKNEKSTVDETEVDGLVYCLAKKLSGFCRGLDEGRGSTLR